jgi:hypothetical protein
MTSLSQIKGKSSALSQKISWTEQDEAPETKSKEEVELADAGTGADADDGHEAAALGAFLSVAEEEVAAASGA